MKFITSIALFASIALAQISAEPSSSTCAGTTYSKSAIDAAAKAALSYWAQGKAIGSGSYPHKYNNYEGFPFTCTAPFLEFPILTSGVFTGGSPGADRVVIGSISSDETRAEYCGLITHTGQSGNAFGECS